MKLENDPLFGDLAKMAEERIRNEYVDSITYLQAMEWEIATKWYMHTWVSNIKLVQRLMAWWVDKSLSRKYKRYQKVKRLQLKEKLRR